MSASDRKRISEHAGLWAALAAVAFLAMFIGAIHISAEHKTIMDKLFLECRTEGGTAERFGSQGFVCLMGNELLFKFSERME